MPPHSISGPGNRASYYAEIAASSPAVAVTIASTHFVRNREFISQLRKAQLLMKLHLRATGCYLPYGITQCYLPPDTSEHTPT